MGRMERLALPITDVVFIRFQELPTACRCEGACSLLLRKREA
jgi:hypothetical protein